MSTLGTLKTKQNCFFCFQISLCPWPPHLPTSFDFVILSNMRARTCAHVEDVGPPEEDEVHSVASSHEEKGEPAAELAADDDTMLS